MTTSNMTDDSTIEASRRFATQALDRASDKMRDLSGSMKDMASRGVSSVTDKTQRYANLTGRYVMEQPLKSALIAAAVGAAVAGIIIALRRNRIDF